MASYEETLNYIYNLRGGEIDLRLDRVERVLAMFGHPERSFPAFHIAGTNGKGSTAAMLHRILSLEGYRAALYTSPHVVSFTERIRVGEEEISRDEVVELAGSLKARLAREGPSLTFFEFVTVMAFIYFAARKADVAAVEVGLGGRLDATNVAMPEVSIITTISKDHEAYLGSDLCSIAREKGGIIKRGVPMVCGSLSPEVAEVLRGMAEAKGSVHYFLGRDFSWTVKQGGLFDYKGLQWRLPDLSVALRGRHQRANAALALGSLEVARQKFPVRERSVREGLSTVFWPGRFELLGQRPPVILDGAHNGEGIKALVAEVRDYAPGKRVKILFAAMEDKDWTSMLRELSAVASEVVLTRVPMERSADPRILARALASDMPVRIMEGPLEALRFLLHRSGPGDVVLVAGSLYLLGEVRPFLSDIAATESRQAGFAGSKL